MIKPTLEVIATTRDMVETFGGYNHNIRIPENEFFDMENMTSSFYPVLSPRAKRGEYSFIAGTSNNNPQGLISKDALCYIDGRCFVINNKRIDLGLSTSADMCPKQLISMGAYVIIMPDKKYINTADLDNENERGNIEATFTSAENDVSFSLCKLGGEAYENVATSNTEPENPSNKDLWIDTSETPHALKQYSSTSSMWISVPTTYVKISASNIGNGFKQFDAVKITGISSEIPLQDLNNQVSVLWEVHHDEKSPGNDYVVVVGMLDETIGQESSITLSRQMPKLDFVIEADNRLWGCRYGEDINGNIVNEIYASKQGDFKNWNCFMGLSTDSYTASCGTDGRWTGAINHLGYPIFFKENCLHKVYGNYPANFQIQTTVCRGVQKGCGNSLAIVNERLLYKSTGGVCAYDGSLPTEISRAFGDVSYSGVDESMNSEWNILRNGAVAGTFNNKYYITMRSENDGKWYMFVYDSSTGMWHKEDELRADAFFACRGDMYFIDHSDSKIKTIFGSGTLDNTPVKWMAETGTLGLSLPDKKYISRLLIRMSLDYGTMIRIFIKYDSVGIWEQVYSAVGSNLRSFSIPIKPKRNDHFSLRFEGVGEAKIYSIVKTIEQGSDV